MTRKHNNILRQIGKLGLITPACVVLLSAKSRSTHQPASLSDMSNTTTEVNQPQTKPKKPRFAKILPHVVLACNKAKMKALKDIAVYLALHSFKPDWKYNNPHIEQTTGLNRHTVTKYLQLLAKLKVLEPVDEKSCRNTKYWILNHAKYAELFETEPDNADTSPLVRALQLSNQWTTEPQNQLSNEWTVSCPISDIQLSNQQPSVVYPVDNSISRYKVDGESKKEHKDSVCVFSHSLSEIAKPKADDFSFADPNESSAVLATDKPEPAASANEGNASTSFVVRDRFASTQQCQVSNRSFSSSSDHLPTPKLTAIRDGDMSLDEIRAYSREMDARSDQAAKETGYDRYDEATKTNPGLTAKTKRDIFITYVNFVNSSEPAFMCPRNLAELALNYFEANPFKSAAYLMAVLDAVESLTWNLLPAEEGYDTHFNLRRSHNLAFLFKHIDRLINEINTLNSEYGFFSLEEKSMPGFRP